MTLEEVVKYYRTNGAIACALGVTRQAINRWRRQGKVPIFSQIMLEKITGGKLKADEVSLRGKDDGRGRSKKD